MASPSHRTRIHLWFPDIFGFKGGIQVYSAFLLEAICQSFPEFDYSVFLKHDQAAPPGEFGQNGQPSPRLHFSGKWPAGLRTSAFAAQIITSALQHPPDLIIATHLHFTPAACWLKQLRGIPYWAIAHGVEAWGVQRPRLQKSLQLADRILSVSNYTRERLLAEQQLDPAKISRLPNTFDASRFRIGPKPPYLLERYGLSPQQPLILTVARLVASEQYKGYVSILRAMPEIVRHIPDVHYLIVGQGNDRPHIEQLVADLGLAGRVTLTGYVPDQELCDHYNLCNVFAMPSKREGFGIVYLEALACGKPTLAGNKDGAIDALCNGELGVLVDPDNVDAIAPALIEILRGNFSHPLLYRPEALRQKVTETYGFSRFKEKLASNLNRFFNHKKIAMQRSALS